MDMTKARTERYWKPDKQGKLIPHDVAILPYSAVLVNDLAALDVMGFVAVCHADEQIIEIERC